MPLVISGKLCYTDKQNGSTLWDIEKEDIKMPIKYKVDALEALKAAGYSSTRLRNEHLLGESYMTQLRHGELVSWKTIETICRLLNCQPGDIVWYEPEQEGA